MKTIIRAKTKATLERYLEDSPVKLYNQSYMRAYAMHGMFGGSKETESAQLSKIKQLTEARKPYVDNHLDVMDQIKTRRNKR